MDRRGFIKSGMGAIGSMTLPLPKRIFGSDESSNPKAQVWKAVGDPVNAARTLTEALGGMDQFAIRGGTVLVKPNIAFPAPPTWGATTDPEFLDAVLDLCIEAGARRIYVIDHPVGTSPEKNLKRSGIGAICEGRAKVTLMMATAEKSFREVPIPVGRSLKATRMLKLLEKIDLFINVPTAKHHTATGVSLGLKNLMGLIWDRVPFHEELDLHQAVADLSTLIRPQLTFLDARYSLLTNGPTGPGQVEETNTYLAGFDPVAVDAVGVGLARWGGRIQTGSNILHLAKAAELGVGEVDDDRIEVLEV
ncbi:hypothetical protein CEE37_11930 [candidate division LCP-89 bacterium B3_LCP]|uniref:DUF362 domain-containing protein n=1 Tax=candidate division LCP-89 bacterium B3_LCP TaxID=2012998 RepID=A0A532UW17_UNCL8|nr:MAG: hypothetical protein CEE37_11930 [candidate division LCP-89 bacterium B3_LCP]